MSLWQLLEPSQKRDSLVHPSPSVSSLLRWTARTGLDQTVRPQIRTLQSYKTRPRAGAPISDKTSSKTAKRSPLTLVKRRSKACTKSRKISPKTLYKRHYKTTLFDKTSVKEAPPRKQKRYHHKPCSKDVAQPLLILTFHHACTKTQTRSPQSVLNTRPKNSLFDKTSWKAKLYIKNKFRTSSKTWQKCVELEHPARLTQLCVMNYSFIHSMNIIWLQGNLQRILRTCLSNTKSIQSLNNFVIVASNVLLYLQHTIIAVRRLRMQHRTSTVLMNVDGAPLQRANLGASTIRILHIFENFRIAFQDTLIENIIGKWPWRK